MNFKKIFLIILIFIVHFSCGKKSSVGPEQVFEKLSKIGNYSESKIYFTNGTIRLIDSAVSKGILEENERSVYLPVFNKKTRWVITNVVNYGNAAGVSIRYTEHPVENLKGTDVTYNLVIENGLWKIDLEKEIKDAFSSYVPESAEKYLKDLLR